MRSRCGASAVPAGGLANRHLSTRFRPGCWNFPIGWLRHVKIKSTETAAGAPSAKPALRHRRSRLNAWAAIPEGAGPALAGASASANGGTSFCWMIKPGQGCRCGRDAHGVVGTQPKEGPFRHVCVQGLRLNRRRFRSARNHSAITFAPCDFGALHSQRSTRFRNSRCAFLVDFTIVVYRLPCLASLWTASRSDCLGIRLRV
jgi:hypothetical protein